MPKFDSTREREIHEIMGGLAIGHEDACRIVDPVWCDDVIHSLSGPGVNVLEVLFQRAEERFGTVPGFSEKHGWALVRMQLGSVLARLSKPGIDVIPSPDLLSRLLRATMLVPGLDLTVTNGYDLILLLMALRAADRFATNEDKASLTLFTMNFHAYIFKMGWSQHGQHDSIDSVFAYFLENFFLSGASEALHLEVPKEYKKVLDALEANDGFIARPSEHHPNPYFRPVYAMDINSKLWHPSLSPEEIAGLVKDRPNARKAETGDTGHPG